MIDKNTRNCNLMKKIINIITAWIAIIIAQIIADKFFDESFAWTLIIMIILLVIFVPVGLFIDKKIDAHYEDKKKL